MRRKGFTLVELLVVIGIIALLISILLPTLSKAKEQANKTKCLSNMKQLGTANQMYLNEFQSWLPFSNWDAGQSGYTNAKDGWLYSTPPTGGRGLNGKPEDVETGDYWPYLKSREIYRCPMHIKGEAGTFGAAQSDALTSYLMNGSVNSFGRGPGGGKIFRYKISQFKADYIMMWEADERGGAAWNDGSSSPSESYNPNDPYAAGLTIRHGKTASVLYFDGHAEWIQQSDFLGMAQQADGKKNAIYCSPDTTNGR